jgi:hypothetical protein
MASMVHEGLLLLFRNRPRLAPELLEHALGLGVPAYSEARVEAAEFTQVVPTEYRADLVVLLLEGKPVLAIVVEVQLSRDEDKRASWPLYLTSLRSRVRCPTVLLVVAPDAAVARWCAQPIELGHPGFRLQPLVAGPDAIPVVSDPEVAGREPELAVLSAMAHGHEEVGPAIAQAVLSSAGGLEDERFRLYVDLAVSSLSEAARRALEALMKSGTYEYQTELFRQWIAQGREEGELAAILEVLDARGIKVDEESRQRLMACKELSQIKLWLRKAVTVQSARELFESEPAPKPAARKAGKGGKGLSTSKPRSKR